MGLINVFISTAQELSVNSSKMEIKKRLSTMGYQHKKTGSGPPAVQHLDNRLYI